MESLFKILFSFEVTINVEINIEIYNLSSTSIEEFMRLTEKYKPEDRSHQYMRIPL